MSTDLEKSISTIHGIVVKLVDKIDEVMRKPPQYEEFNEFSAVVKPKVSLSSLGYDHTKYDDIENTVVLQSSKMYTNLKLKECGISVDYEVPAGKSKLMDNNPLYQQMKKDAGIVNKNTDYIFVINFA